MDWAVTRFSVTSLLVTPLLWLSAGLEGTRCMRQPYDKPVLYALPGAIISMAPGSTDCLEG